MDEENYKAARAEIVPVPCVFEKAILAARVRCSKAKKMNLAQREVVRCAGSECQTRCQAWLQIMREKSRFALQLDSLENVSVPLPHGKEMRVQVGGIEGLSAVLAAKAPETESGLADVFAMLDAGFAQYGSLAYLPFSELVKAVAHCRVRRG